VITIPTRALTDGTGAGRLNDGVQISPSLSAYLVCDAKIIPAFLDCDGNLINLGRARRTFTGPARLALELRDRGCAWPGCDRPISWTQAHHILGWVKGGGTDQNNGVLLCGYHHREIERGDWEVFVHHGRAWFRPPTWIDPDRTPILNPMHHPTTPAIARPERLRGRSQPVAEGGQLGVVDAVGTQVGGGIRDANSVVIGASAIDLGRRSGARSSGSTSTTAGSYIGIER